jgi:aspartate 4-decarboxylase
VTMPAKRIISPIPFPHQPRRCELGVIPAQTPSPFGLRRELEIEADAVTSIELLPRLDSGQGNPNNFGHLDLRKAFAELLQISSRKKAGSSPFSTRLPRPSGPLWKAAAQLAKINDQRISDVLQELVLLTYAAKYPVQPQPVLVNLALKQYIRAVHGLGSSVVELGDVQLTAGASAGSYLVLRAFLNSRVIPPDAGVIVLSPIYSPLVELCDVNGLRTTVVYEDARNDSVSPQLRQEIERKSNRLLLTVHPGNPDGRARSLKWIKDLATCVRKRDDLFVIEDAAYAPFIRDCPSLISELPANTVLLGSFSKIVGMCGVRVGYIATAISCLIDRTLDESPMPERYSSRVRRGNSFVERCWLEAGDVSFSHTGSVSTHSIVLAALFAALWLSDPSAAERYRSRVQVELDERYTALLDGLGLDRGTRSNVPACSYHAWIDLHEVILSFDSFGASLDSWLQANLSTLQVVRHIAHSQNAIVLPGDGFRAPGKFWIRACVGNLNDAQECFALGERIRAAVRELRTWQESGEILCSICRDRFKRS